jgi:hypothetical protein
MSEQPKLPPERPWLTRSAWSISPFLVFQEAAGILSCWLFMVAVGAAPDLMVTLVVMGFTAYHAGRRCAVDEEGQVPRRRLYGTALLVSLVEATFLYLLVRSHAAELAKLVEADAALMQKLREADPTGAVPLEDWVSAMLLIGMSFFAGLLFALHSLCLILGARAVELRRPPPPNP